MYKYLTNNNKTKKMERDLTIHYQKKLFGSLTFYYDENYKGNILAHRKELTQTSIDSSANTNLSNIYSKLERFEHPKTELEHLSTLDKTYVYGLFGKEIDDNKLNRSAFEIIYTNQLEFSKVLFDENNQSIANVKITINSAAQTKVFSFEPLHPSLEHFRQQTKVPFTKINSNILYDFKDTQINSLFPESYYL